MTIISGTIGAVKCAQADKIISTYKKFGIHFIGACVIGYILLSVTLVLFFPVIFLILLGPLLGTLVFVIFSSAAILTSFVLLLLGKFPSNLFIGRHGVLRPYESLPALSFQVATYFIPYALNEFVLEGIDACYPEIGTEATRTNMHKASQRRKMMIIIFNMSQNLFFKVLCRLLTLFIIPHDIFILYFYPILLSIQLGSQLASRYTLSIRRWSVTEHMIWCRDNVFRLIGFTLPFVLLERWEYVSAIVFLGFGHAISATLVEPIIFQDSCPREKREGGFYNVKVT